MDIAPELLPLTEPIGAVKLKPGNARRHDLVDLQASLKELGQYRPIIANRATGHIIKGNGTWQAAKKLGATHIAVSWVDVPEGADETRLVVVDNRTAELGWMNDAVLLEGLQGLADLTGTGYVPNDVDWLERSLQPSAIGLPPAPSGGAGPTSPDPESFGASGLRQLVLPVMAAEYDVLLADLDSLAQPGENVPLVVKRLVMATGGPDEV